MDPANQNQQTGDNESKKPENTGGEDWQSKFEGQRKVNRDLEKKLNEAYAKADKVDELEKQIAALRARKPNTRPPGRNRPSRTRPLPRRQPAHPQGRSPRRSQRQAHRPGRRRATSTCPNSPSRMTAAWTTQAIADSIGELLEQKPYLGKAEQAPSGANITPPSGTRDGDRHQGQLTRDDLKTMSPAEIVKAQQDGRLKDLLGAN